MTKTAKTIIDMIALLLFVLLLGYSFTGGQLHEILGLLFAAVVVYHNIVNRKWYSVLKRKNLSKRVKTSIVINIALIADTAALVLTGILSSRYLFHTVIHIGGIGRITQLHSLLAMVGFVLIAAHLLVHAITHTKKSAKKLFVWGTAISLLLAVLLHIWLLPYVKRHFYTVRINCAEAITGAPVDTGGRKIAIVYFTRVGNSHFEADVDAVSGASLLLNEEDELMGNSQVIAQMVEDAVAGDLIPIRVENKYPSSYGSTVSAAGKELKSGELPSLVNMPESLAEYDTVVLVYPLWWWTIPKPVEAFLRGYDFSGKTILPIVTHGGSGAGDSLADIKAICSGAVTGNPLTVYCGDTPYCRDSVSLWLEEVLADLEK